MTSAHPLRENHTEQKGQKKIVKDKKEMRRKHKSGGEKPFSHSDIKIGKERGKESTREGKLNIYITIMQRKAGCLRHANGKYENTAMSRTILSAP